MTPRRTHLFAAASAAVLGLAFTAPVLAAHDLRGAGGSDVPLQQSTSTPTATPTATASPGRGPEGRGPENAPGRQAGASNGAATSAKTPPALPANASERARTVVQAVFERNAQVRALFAEMRAARGLPAAGANADVTDEFAKNAKQKQTGDTVVDPKTLTAEQREQFQAQLKAIMAAFAETLRQSASTTANGATSTPTATATATSTATTTATATATAMATTTATATATP